MKPAGGRGRRWWWWGKRLLMAGGAVAGAIAAANAYVVGTTRAAIVADVSAAPARPDAVVLGNRVAPDGTPCSELAARLETALALYRAGRASKVVVSGRVATGGYDEPSGMAAWLVDHGVAAADVVKDPGGHRTAATMADTAALGKRSILIVTQGYHLPRSLYFARHAGIDAIGVPAPARPRTTYDWLKVSLREVLARAESVVEVAFRGVRAR